MVHKQKVMNVLIVFRQRYYKKQIGRSGPSSAPCLVNLIKTSQKPILFYHCQKIEIIRSQSIMKTKGNEEYYKYECSKAEK